MPVSINASDSDCVINFSVLYTSSIRLPSPILRFWLLDYSHAWSELILQKDLFFFGSGDAAYEQLPTDVALIPTEEEVLEQKNTSRSRRVANAAASFSQV
ncbi:hypothetical protein PCANC_04586 [Puccinia coronata f. sp. avenae]|uniref:Uncharacterized protein n=1 Tax=Puccinia coronata f. sp. avenae TaxID=200324 RepID=A0A2N5W096_9BASI|nr:hypothetical protein PCANC_21547 [Puccinia coronata f. sp. avenae]PLW55673.1 hypothetical protein PCANC_04586 [Puccinia coronata f. sp. avenae]